MIHSEAGTQFRLFARALTGLALALTLVAFWAGSSLAEDSPQAGLLVFYDEETIDYFLVDVSDDDMKGMELLESTGLDLEIQPFGGLGEAVCSIDGHGCPSSNCFCESYSSPVYFWRYYVHEDGQWLPQLRGASQREVEPGEIHAFAWADDNQQLPDITFEELTILVHERNTESAPDATPVTTPKANADPQGTLDPEPSTTPVESTDDSEASADEDQDGAGGTTNCVQFLALLGLLVGIVFWAGVRRYRTGTDT